MFRSITHIEAHPNIHFDTIYDAYIDLPHTKDIEITPHTSSERNAYGNKRTFEWCNEDYHYTQDERSSELSDKAHELNIQYADYVFSVGVGNYFDLYDTIDQLAFHYMRKFVCGDCFCHTIDDIEYEHAEPCALCVELQVNEARKHREVMYAYKNTRNWSANIKFVGGL